MFLILALVLLLGAWSLLLVLLVLWLLLMLTWKRVCSVSLVWVLGTTGLLMLVGCFSPLLPICRVRVKLRMLRVVLAGMVGMIGVDEGRMGVKLGLAGIVDVVGVQLGRLCVCTQCLICTVLSELINLTLEELSLRCPPLLQLSLLLLVHLALPLPGSLLPSPSSFANMEFFFLPLLLRT